MGRGTESPASAIPLAEAMANESADCPVPVPCGLRSSAPRPVLPERAIQTPAARRAPLARHAAIRHARRHDRLPEKSAIAIRRTSKSIARSRPRETRHRTMPSHSLAKPLSLSCPAFPKSRASEPAPDHRERTPRSDAAECRSASHGSAMSRRSSSACLLSTVQSPATDFPAACSRLLPKPSPHPIRPNASPWEIARSTFARSAGSPAASVTRTSPAPSPVRADDEPRHGHDAWLVPPTALRSRSLTIVLRQDLWRHPSAALPSRPILGARAHRALPSREEFDNARRRPRRSSIATTIRSSDARSSHAP